MRSGPLNQLFEVWLSLHLIGLSLIVVPESDEGQSRLGDLSIGCRQEVHHGVATRAAWEPILAAVIAQGVIENERPVPSAHS